MNEKTFNLEEQQKQKLMQEKENRRKDLIQRVYMTGIVIGFSLLIVAVGIVIKRYFGAVI